MNIHEYELDACCILSRSQNIWREIRNNNSSDLHQSAYYSIHAEVNSENILYLKNEPELVR